MPTFTLTLPHTLAPEEAAARIRGFAGELRARHPEYAGKIRESWEGNHARFEGTVMGFAISGDIEASRDAVRITVTYPFMAAPFRGRIEAQVRETIESLLT